MPNRSNLCIQIGLHKAGTTTLNYEVYAKHSGLHHLGKPYDFGSPIHLLLEEILYASHRHFDAVKCRALFDRAVRPHLKGNKVVTINEASLSRAIGVERDIVAERVRKVFGQCKILIVLRRQDEILRSFYFQHYGTKKTRLKFDAWLRESWPFARPAPFSMIEYCGLIEPYVALFGLERVGILLYEDLHHDRDAFARQLSDFLGIDADETVRLMAVKARNPRMSRLHLFVRKHTALERLAVSVRSASPGSLNHALRWLANRSGRANAEFSTDMATRLLEYVGESNAKLAKDYGLPLDKHGYPM